MSVGDALGWLRAARRVVAFTGAGVSTASGLPDFRSAGGLWAGVDPASVASRAALERDPAAFYAFYRARLSRLDGAVPNPAHRALAALERAGRLRAVITQNVDGLHQAAGSTRVIEIHGNLREAACIACGGIAPITSLLAPLEAGGLPRCERCGGLLKPNVVLFDDPMPADAWRRAVLEARAADVMLVVGSSLQVTPAAYLPRETLDRGGVLVIVNREPTAYDPDAAVVIHGEADRILPELARGLGGEEAASAATN